MNLLLENYLSYLQLKTQRGRHTELVSFYADAGRATHEIVAKLNYELNECSNIKDSENRKAVRTSLEKVLYAFKHLDLTYGLAVFSNGYKTWHVAGTKSNLLKHKGYLCEKYFKLEPLHELIVGVKVKLGLILVDTHEGMIASANGGHLHVIKYRDGALIPSKTCKGGQSAKRYQKVIAKGSEEMYAALAEDAQQAFFEMRNELSCILVGGSFPGVHDFLNTNFLVKELSVLVKGPYTVPDVDKLSLRVLCEKGSQHINQLEELRQEKALEKLLKLKAERKAYTGLKAVQHVLETAHSACELVFSEDFLMKGQVLNCERANLLRLWAEVVTNFKIIDKDSVVGRYLFNFDGLAAIIGFKT